MGFWCLFGVFFQLFRLYTTPLSCNFWMISLCSSCAETKVLRCFVFLKGLVVLRLELELLWSMVHSNQLKMVLLKMITVGTKVIQTLRNFVVFQLNFDNPFVLNYSKLLSVSYLLQRQICYTWNRLLVLVSPILQMNHSTTP